MGIDSEQIAVVEQPQQQVVPAYPPPPPPPAYPPPDSASPFGGVAVAPVPVPVAAKRGGRAWIVPTAVAVVGVIASGSLGYLLYSTNNQLEASRHELTQTQLTLDSTKKDLDGEKAQAAYVQLVDTDIGREGTDYALISECDSFNACRSATQTMLTDSQAFQSDLQTAKTPGAFGNVNSMLEDSLSAEITALKDLLSAINSRQDSRIQAAYNELSDASLSLFKAETALARISA